MELGLERISSALAALNLARPSFPLVQVLGTNGKGSCASFLAALGAAHKLSCGLFLSPHFVSVEERIRVNGKTVSRKLWLECANILRARLKDSLNLTYFEFLTVLALQIFSRLKVDMAVFEAGLGGKNDATSVIPANMHCITPIAMDHANIIGPALSDIALDKAWAIQPHTMVFSSPQSMPVRKILEHMCKRRNTSLEFIEVDPLLPKPALRGEMQKANASLALHAWRAFARQRGLRPSREMEREAMEKAFIPGRFQKIVVNDKLPPLILDGAHNPHAISALLKNLEDDKPCAIVFSALADKDWNTSLELIDSFLGPVPMFIPLLENARAASPVDIMTKRNSRYPDSASIFLGKSALSDAISAAAQIPNPQGKPILLTGSFYLLADFFSLYPQYLES